MNNIIIDGLNILISNEIGGNQLKGNQGLKGTKVPPIQLRVKGRDRKGTVGSLSEGLEIQANILYFGSTQII
jgi:hypothetical protein